MVHNCKWWLDTGEVYIVIGQHKKIDDSAETISNVLDTVMHRVPNHIDTC